MLERYLTRRRAPSSPRSARLTKAERPHRPDRDLREPRDPQPRLIAQLLQLAQGHAELVSSWSRPWASATFVGQQHRLVLTIREDKPSEAEGPCHASSFASAIGEAEFAIPGHIVADVAVDERETSYADGAIVTRIVLSALTIEEW